MGLLRKAAHPGTSGTRAVSPSAPIERPEGPPPGLLGKSSRLLQTEEAHAEQTSAAELPAPLSVELAAETAPRPAAEPLLDEIVSAIRGLPQGVELPSLLFSTVASRLAVEKGALLLYDPLRLVYAPWASHGFDQTTLHRMRIPLGANESFNALANGSAVALSDPAALAAYQQYFSAREFSSISRLLLTPLITEEKLAGVLLITEVAPPFREDPQLLRYLQRVAEAGSPLVQKARGEKLAKAGPQVIRSAASPADEISRFLATYGSRPAKVLFLSLSLEEYAQEIAAAHEHLDAFRLHEDMRYFVSAFVADLGIAAPVRQGFYIMGLMDFDASDLDLFTHQLTRHLDGLFGGNGRSRPLNGPRVLKTRSWPADGSDLQELVDFLSS